MANSLLGGEMLTFNVFQTKVWESWKQNPSTVGYIMSQKYMIFVRVKEKLVVPGLQMCTFCSPSHPDDREHGNNARWCPSKTSAQRFPRFPCFLHLLLDVQDFPVFFPRKYGVARSGDKVGLFLLSRQMFLHPDQQSNGLSANCTPHKTQMMSHLVEAPTHLQSWHPSL